MAEHSILVRKADSGGPWVDPETKAYDNEAHLQELLAKDPDRLPGVSSGAMAVCELPTSAGPIDVCVIEPTGEITVVECKLSTNSEKRRMVIGQVIDYASAIREDGPSLLRSRWVQRGGMAIDEFLDPEALAALDQNLEKGRINLCLAVDLIDDDLRRLIEYLNLIAVDDVRVTALQLRYARHGDLEILIPSSFGSELKDFSNPKPKRDPWTWHEFIESLSSEDDRKLAEELRSRAELAEKVGTHDSLWFGTKPGGGIFVHISGQRYAAFQLWRSTSGELRVFGNWRSWPKIEKDERFAPLASLLGQSHEAGMKSFPVSKLDLDEFWAVAVACDLAINESPEEVSV
jgi:hypothetical protein